jgi:hypothetical protein
MSVIYGGFPSKPTLLSHLDATPFTDFSTLRGTTGDAFYFSLPQRLSFPFSQKWQRHPAYIGAVVQQTG